ncbi:DUF5937 family protein [Sphaerimonospora thailandensis]|uniref:Transcriptional regulator n=1 Tax=Sphaerimonospora thailandensis TaxID=795644 RepID=A0A8J3R4Z9_9ACTN|nr:DUF5937 family protein [Sphaerimonospora thailandensis]GIH68603.1 transcriptional regulator [Sphaerimonospora thailandensis]
MAVQLLVETADLLKCRFALSPLWETVAAVRTLTDPRRQAYHLPWLRNLRPQLDEKQLSPLLTLLPHTGYTPDFLTPPPTGPLSEIEDELARVADTPTTHVREELDRCLHGPERNTPPPPEVADRLLADPARTLAQLVTLIRACWNWLIAPQWTQLRDLLDADIAVRSRQLTEGGLHRMLTELHPTITWHELGALHIAAPHQTRHPLNGQGLLLLPSAFVWPALTVVVEAPWQPTLIYPARGVGDLWQSSPHPPAPRSLQRLIGRTRAKVLTSLSKPTSTSTLARNLGLSPATVSEHLATLRDAGLVSRYRVGRTVYYAPTALGTALGQDPAHGTDTAGGRADDAPIVLKP